MDTFSDRGEKVAHALVTIFAVGVKGVTDKRMSPLNIPAVEPPNRPPDSTVEQRTSPDQVRTRMHVTCHIGSSSESSNFCSRGAQCESQAGH